MMDWTLIDKVSFGLDLATAVSIIGAVIAFIYNNIKMNQKSVGEERERLRVIRLIGIQEDFSKYIIQFIAIISQQKSEDELLKNMKTTYYYLKESVYPNFIMLANDDDITAVERMMGEIENIAELINTTNNLNPRNFAEKMIELDKSMLIQIRQLMNVESVGTSKTLVNRYSQKKYGI